MRTNLRAVRLARNTALGGVAAGSVHLRKAVGSLRAVVEVEVAGRRHGEWWWEEGLITAQDLPDGSDEGNSHAPASCQ